MLTLFNWYGTIVYNVTSLLAWVDCIIVCSLGGRFVVHCLVWRAICVPFDQIAWTKLVTRSPWWQQLATVISCDHPARFHPDHIQEFLAKKKRKSEGWKCVVRLVLVLADGTGCRFSDYDCIINLWNLLNQVCLKTFTRRPHLQEHMILHTQDRPFKCSFCDEYFKSRFARLKHQEKYHLGKQILQILKKIC